MLSNIIHWSAAAFGGTPFRFNKCTALGSAGSGAAVGGAAGGVPGALVGGALGVASSFLAPALAVKACLKYAVSLIGQVFVNTNTFCFKLS